MPSSLLHCGTLHLFSDRISRSWCPASPSLHRASLPDCHPHHNEPAVPLPEAVHLLLRCCLHNGDPALWYRKKLLPPASCYLPFRLRQRCLLFPSVPLLRCHSPMLLQRIPLSEIRRHCCHSRSVLLQPWSDIGSLKAVCSVICVFS